MPPTAGRSSPLILDRRRIPRGRWHRSPARGCGCARCRRRSFVRRATPVQVSTRRVFGVACSTLFDRGALTVMAMACTAADDALYRAKREGRNRVSAVAARGDADRSSMKARLPLRLGRPSNSVRREALLGALRDPFHLEDVEGPGPGAVDNEGAPSRSGAPGSPPSTGDRHAREVPSRVFRSHGVPRWRFPEGADVPARHLATGSDVRRQGRDAEPRGRADVKSHGACVHGASVRMTVAGAREVLRCMKRGCLERCERFGLG